jgi:GDPmannose 4,6-dehydratase
MKKTALIIGVTGQDGAYLAKHLLEKNYIVYGTSRDHESSHLANLNTLKIRDHVKMNTMVSSDFRSVLNLLQKSHADEIYNLAGQTSVGMSFNYPVETFDSITRGTVNLLECIRLLGKSVRFFNAGSSECFGNTEIPATEETSFRPRSPYATAKAAATYAVQNYRESYGIFATTGILFNHESPLRLDRFVTKKIIKSAVRISKGSKEKLHLGNTNIERDWGWAPEYVDAMWRMLQYKLPEDFVISSGQKNSLMDFVEKTFTYLKLNARDHLEIKPELFRPSDVSRSFGNPIKANKFLSWKAQKNIDNIIENMILYELKKINEK